MPHGLCMLAKLPGISFIDSDNANAYLATDAPTQGLGVRDFGRRTPEPELKPGGKSNCWNPRREWNSE